MNHTAIQILILKSCDHNNSFYLLKSRSGRSAVKVLFIIHDKLRERLR